MKPTKYLSQIPLAYSFTVFSVVLLFSGAALSNLFESKTSFTPKEAHAAESVDTALLQRTSESFRSIAKKMGAAVVAVRSTRTATSVQTHSGGNGRGFDESAPFPPLPFSDDFEEFGLRPRLPSPPRENTGVGSGFLIDPKGYLVTNHHVIDGAAKITVTLPQDDTIEVPAKLIGGDPKTDIAVLKIESNEALPYVEWADSDKVEVGDWAIAIGNPFMLTHTVTSGIVSAKGRRGNEIAGTDYAYDMLQTDAAINPGNSGGPLATIEGKVMGVNTAIFTQSGGYMGIGFAVPSNLAKHVVNSLIEKGRVVRGWMGVSIKRVDTEMAKELGIKSGVLIHEVMSHSPAEEAKLQPGDVITEVSGKPVRDTFDVQHVVAETAPGDSLSLSVLSYQDKRARTVTVKIREVSTEKPLVRRSFEEPTSPDKFGVMIRQSSAKDGVYVSRVKPGSPGELAGLRPNDRILSVNRIPIRTASQYREVTSKTKRLNVIVEREGRELFVELSNQG